MVFPRLRKLLHVFVMFGLEGLSPIGVWDVLDGWTHDGHETSMVIICVGRTMGNELLCSRRLQLGEESLGW